MPMLYAAVAPVTNSLIFRVARPGFKAGHLSFFPSYRLNEILMARTVAQRGSSAVDRLQLNMVQVVRSVPLFASLREADWADVAPLLHGFCYPRDTYLFFEGDSPDFLYVIWMGRMKLLRHSVDGRDVVLDVLVPGRLLGEVAVFEGAPYSQTAQTMEDVAVISIARNDYLYLLQRIPCWRWRSSMNWGTGSESPTIWFTAWRLIGLSGVSLAPCCAWQPITALLPRMD